MNQAQSAGGKIPLTIAAVIVMIASFLPWATAAANPIISQDGSVGPEISLSTSTWNGNFQPLTLKIPITLVISAWNGNVVFFGLIFPNWLVAVAAVAIAAIAWLEASATWKGPRVLSAFLAAYGLLHVSSFMVGLRTLEKSPIGKSTVGIGSLFTALGFTMMLYLLVKNRRGMPSKASSPMWGEP